MSPTSHKPKLVFFQYRYDNGLPEFLLAHKREHAACLSLHFDLVLIQENCDYREICDLHQPDMALFESGVNLFTCKKPIVRNVKSNDTIPKVGLLNADAWCETRSGSLSEMDSLGIDTLFSISTTIPEHLSSITSDLFVWPNFIDPAIYRDYGESKLIPVLLSGATAEQYPWRRRIYKLAAEHYPVLWCPHRGYLSRSSNKTVLHGVDYARTINAAEVAPVCGTVAREVVRKHFEIPACNTCLITERTRAIQAAGFEDMVNCVFADEHDVLDRLEYLFNNPEKLQEITAAGHRLVHSRHTAINRNQLLQWFRLKQHQRPTDTIVQENPFAPLRLVNGSHAAPEVPLVELGLHLQLLREGDRHLLAGEINRADQCYAASLTYMRRFPEARFKRALCKLYEGEASAANASIFELIQYCLSEYGGETPDPVEWAYYAISQLCMGRATDAIRSSREFPNLDHPELDKVREALQLLDTGHSSKTSKAVAIHGLRTIHQLPQRTEDSWYQQLYSMLRASGQVAIVEKLANARLISIERLPAVAQVPPRSRANAHSNFPRLRARMFVDPIHRRLITHRIKRKAGRVTSKLSRLFIPVAHVFRSSPPDAVDDPMIAAISRTLQGEIIRSALVISRQPAKIGTALRKINPGSQSDLLICSIPRVQEHSTEAKRMNGRQCELTQELSPEAFAMQLDGAMNRFLSDHQIRFFDALIIDWPAPQHSSITSVVLQEQLAAAAFIALGDMKVAQHNSIYSRLLEEAPFVLLDVDDAARSYVILKRQRNLSRPSPPVTESSSDYNEGPAGSYWQSQPILIGEPSRPQRDSHETTRR
jgi:hypothetical protein